MKGLNVDAEKDIMERIICNKFLVSASEQRQLRSNNESTCDYSSTYSCPRKTDTYFFTLFSSA